MILRLSVDIFDGTTVEEGRLLRRLLYRLDEQSEVHALLLDPDPETQDDASSVHAWVSTLGEDDQQCFRSLIMLGPLVEQLQHVGVASARAGCWRRSGPLRVMVQRRTVSDWRSLQLTLSDTLDLIDEPVHLLLENARHDLDFLTWLGSSETRRALKHLLSTPRAPRVSGGGTGELESHLRPLAERAVLEPSELRRLWKTWVMFDMDAGPLDAREKSDPITRLIEHCEAIHQRHGVPLSWVCLQRREIESYLPDAALRQVRDQRAGETLRRLRIRGDRASWAWAYDMKRGLRGDLLGTVPEERRDQLNKRAQVPQPHELKRPFDQLDDQARRALARGFGGAVLNGALAADRPPDWLDQLGFEYDRGPHHQLPRAELLQSIFDRV